RSRAATSPKRHFLPNATAQSSTSFCSGTGWSLRCSRKVRLPDVRDMGMAPPRRLNMRVRTRAYTAARWEFRYSNVMTTGLTRAVFMSAVARRRHELFIGIMLLAELTQSLSVKCDEQVD